MPEQSAFSPQLSDLTVTFNRTHCEPQISDTTVTLKQQISLIQLHDKEKAQSPINKLTPSVRSLSYRVTSFLPSTTSGVISSRIPSVTSQCSWPGRVT